MDNIDIVDKLKNTENKLEKKYKKSETVMRISRATLSTKLSI